MHQNDVSKFFKFHTPNPSLNKIHLISDSIGKMYLQDKLKLRYPGSLIADCNEGSQTSMGLAIQADEYYALLTGENALPYSNDLTNAAWLKTDAVAVTKETLRDGTVWNKIVKTDAQASKGVIGATTFPARASATGAAVQFEIYTPLTNACTSLSVYLVKYASGPESGEKRINLTNLQPGKKQKVVVFFDKAKLPNGSPSVWDDGNTIQVRIWPNNMDGSNPGTIYIRNINVSYKSPSGVENYTETGAAAAAGTSATLQKLDINEYVRNGLSGTIIIFGRNDANWNGDVGIDAAEHYRAYDKLISHSRRWTGKILLLNCPPKKHDTMNIWDANDSYTAYGNNFNDWFNKLIMKWGSGINLYERIRDLGLNPSQVMWDLYHQNDYLAKWIDEWIGEAFSFGNVNTALPELSGSTKHYLASVGTPTGSFSLNTELIINNYADTIDSFLNTPLGWMNDISMVTATANDKLSFSGINGRQLHVHYRIKEGFGTFFVKLNPGTPREQTFGFNANYIGQANARRGYFVCKLPFGDNTVDIVNQAGENHFLGLTVA